MKRLTAALFLVTVFASAPPPKAPSLEVAPDVAQRGKSTPEMEKVIGALKDIPVDITPVYPAAGEE